jgi:hypothetical protein
MENNLVSIDDLKSLYFKDENKLFSQKTQKQDFHIKSTTEILSNITKNGSFQKVNETYKLGLILKKILLQSHLNWITYVYYKNKKLIIGTNSHIGQSELNMQKYILVENLKRVEKYQDIEGVSIFRDETISKTNQKIENKTSFTPEKSYGIFDNYLQDDKLNEIIERIKISIRNVKS